MTIDQRQLPVDAAPDWNSVAREVLCPLCGYNLRGLSDPRCPECGHRSTWQSLQQGDSLPHPYLFEMHPESNAGSFTRTLLHSQEPISFWLKLKPAHKPNLRRLILYWALVEMIVIVSLLILPVLAMVHLSTTIESERARLLASANAWPAPQRGAIIRMYGSVQSYVNARYPDISLKMLPGVAGRVLLSREVLSLLALSLAWPWLSAGLVLAFREALQSARIRAVHVLRAAIYSADVLILSVPIALLFIYWPSQVSRGSRYWLYLYISPRVDPDMMLFFAVLSLLLMTRMILAMRLYLRLPRAIWLAVISQLFVLLLLVKILELALG
jgi:hypothetical protein